MQRHNLAKSQPICAILTADRVSWFQLHNATSAKPVIPQIISDTATGDVAPQNTLLEQDTRWVDTTLTKIYCEVTVKLHVYGLRADASSETQTDAMPSQPLKAAIADAVQTVTNDLCGSSSVLLASSPTHGIDLLHQLPDTTNHIYKNLLLS